MGRKSIRPDCPACGQETLTGKLEEDSYIQVGKFEDEVFTYSTICENLECHAVVVIDTNYKVFEWFVATKGEDNGK